MIILTNDDGIDAPGIEALRLAVPEISMLIAPHQEVSACSHCVTTKAPIAIERRSATRIAVHGTPADCVRLAIKQFTPQMQLVLSGINRGGNLGADVYISGTVAAAREAAFHGIPAIALSQYCKGKGREFEPDWPRATRWADQVLQQLKARPAPVGSYWNVNFPALAPTDPEPQLIFCQRSRHPLPVQYQQQGDHLIYSGNYHQRTSEPGSDVAICFGGDIAITQEQI
jgi:5'-nucleotidase